MRGRVERGPAQGRSGAPLHARRVMVASHERQKRSTPRGTGGKGVHLGHLLLELPDPVARDRAHDRRVRVQQRSVDLFLQVPLRLPGRPPDPIRSGSGVGVLPCSAALSDQGPARHETVASSAAPPHGPAGAARARRAPKPARRPACCTAGGAASPAARCTPAAPPPRGTRAPPASAPAAPPVLPGPGPSGLPSGARPRTAAAE